jgi:hypothetical protein
MVILKATAADEGSLLNATTIGFQDNGVKLLMGIH